MFLTGITSKVKKLVTNLISWLNIKGNGPKAFWGTTGLIFLLLLFLPNDPDGEITQKILLLLSSPIITLALFSLLWAIWILWTEVIFPIAKYIQRRFSS